MAVVLPMAAAPHSLTRTCLIAAGLIAAGPGLALSPAALQVSLWLESWGGVI